MKKVFVAGPMFSESELWFDKQIAELIEKLGFKVFWCHEDEKEVVKNLKPDEKWTDAVFRLIINTIDKCDIVVANLDGIDIDSGTGWEIGYAYAKGKEIIGIRTDSRLYEKDQIVNLMIQESAIKIVKSLEEVEEFLLGKRY